jgi:RNA polymerase sigma-70 factor, ECF subfamily
MSASSAPGDGYTVEPAMWVHESARAENHVMRPFERFYTAHYQEIAGYVRRRIAPDVADDVISQVFMVAWRRFDRVPAPPQDRLWLFGVARNSVADQHRAERRRLRLHARLSQEAVTAPPVSVEADPRHVRIRAAMATLRPGDREALQLVLWEELSHQEAAAVLRCSPNAFEIRYRRARNAVRDAVAAAPLAPQADQERLIRTPTTSRTYPS